MNSVSQKILDEAMELPETERRRVTEVLLDSFSSLDHQKIESAWYHEAIQRAERIERGEAQTLDGAQALAELVTHIKPMK